MPKHLHATMTWEEVTVRRITKETGCRDLEFPPRVDYRAARSAGAAEGRA